MPESPLKHPLNPPRTSQGRKRAEAGQDGPRACKVAGLLLGVLAGALSAACAPDLRSSTFDGEQLWEQIEYSGQRRDGSYVRYHRDGSVECRGAYRDGLPHGEWQEFHEDGSPRSTSAFAGGLKQGFWTAWYPDGVKRFEGRWEDGLRQGPWTYWKPDGAIDLEEGWEDGTRISQLRH